MLAIWTMMATPTRSEPIVIDDEHGCCGCSCHVCAAGHRAGQHTEACEQRFWGHVEHVMSKNVIEPGKIKPGEGER